MQWGKVSLVSTWRVMGSSCENNLSACGGKWGFAVSGDTFTFCSSIAWE